MRYDRQAAQHTTARVTGTTCKGSSSPGLAGSRSLTALVGGLLSYDDAITLGLQGLTWRGDPPVTLQQQMRQQLPGLCLSKGLV